MLRDLLIWRWLNCDNKMFLNLEKHLFKEERIFGRAKAQRVKIRWSEKIFFKRFWNGMQGLNNPKIQDRSPSLELLLLTRAGGGLATLW